MTAPQAQKVIKAWAVVTRRGVLADLFVRRNHADEAKVYEDVHMPENAPHRVVLLTGKVVKRG